MTPRTIRFPSARVAACVMVLIAFVGTAAAARAQAPQGGGVIVVQAVGRATARPNRLELRATLAADEAAPADAAAKFRQAQQRATEEVKKLDIPNLSIETNAMTIGGANPAAMLAMMQGNAPDAVGKPNFHLSRALTLVLTGVDKLDEEKLVDTVIKITERMKDVGVNVGISGPQNMAEFQMAQMTGNLANGKPGMVFKYDNPDALREKAYAAAIADARKKAAKLAELSGIPLGAIASITEGPAVSSEDETPQSVNFFNGITINQPNSASPNLEEVRVMVNLTVQFGVEKK